MNRLSIEHPEAVPRRAGLERTWPVLIAAALALHTILALGYLRALPIFNWPDEPAHFNFVLDLASGGGLPSMQPDAWAPELLGRLQSAHFQGIDPLTDASIERLRYQAHQPPLYYLLAAAWFRAWPSPTGLKLLNLVISCTALVLGGALARRLAPRAPGVWIGAVTLLALWPSRCFLAVSIGNDPAAELAFTAFLLAVVGGWRPVAVGAAAGIGILTKASLVLALPLYIAWLVLRSTRVENGPGKGSAAGGAIRSCLVACAVALAIAGPWIARNVVLYGWQDPLALEAGAFGWRNAETGIERPTLGVSGPNGVVPFLSTLYQSAWGVFGWMEMFPEPPVLTLYVALTALVAAGWLRVGFDRRVSLPAGERLAAGWLALSLTVLVTSVVLYGLRDYQPQGRYLLAAAAAAAFLFGRGLVAACGRAWPWVLGAGAAALVAVDLRTILHVIPWYLDGGG